VVTNTNPDVIGDTASWTSEIVIVGVGYHFVSLYDKNLDFSEIEIVRDDLSEFDSVSAWYLADGTSPVTDYNLTADVNFYALPNVHEVLSESDLDAVRNNLYHNYILFNNIELTALTLDETTGWTPIGTGTDSVSPFSGIFNGNGYKITGLFIEINSSNPVYAGLFGYLRGSVRNLGVEMSADGINVSSSNFSNVGGIAGGVNGGTIENSYSKGDISSSSSISDYIPSSSYAGGIAGYVYRGTIENSYSAGDISSSSNSSSSDPYYSSESYAGGIAGMVANTTIENSYSAGNISSSSDSSSSYSYSFAGGIAGVLGGGTIENSYSTGDITSYSSSSDNIDSYSNAGGIAGWHNGGTIKNNAAINAEIKVSSSASYKYLGRIFGDGVSGSIGNNFALDDMEAIGGSFNTTPANHGVDKTVDALKDSLTYETGLGWQFCDGGLTPCDDHPWKMPPEDSEYLYPILYWQIGAPQ
jgi:hypothetical protein